MDQRQAAQAQTAATEETSLLEQILADVQAAGKDTTALTRDDRAALLVGLARKLGLNALSGAVMFLKTNGRETLYVTKQGTDQIAARERLKRETIKGPEVVTIENRKIVLCQVRATHPDGRSEVSTGTLALLDPVNDLMKCETKAKRRATLSVCGLGLLAEDEIETIPGASSVPFEAPREAPRSEPPANDAKASEPAEEGPSSRAFSAFFVELSKADTLAAIHNAYAGLLDGLNEEGADVEYWTQGNDGAGTLAYKRIETIGHRIVTAEKAQVLRARPLAELLDTQTNIRPAEDSLHRAAEWWVSHRAEVKKLEPAHQKTPWYALVRRYSGSSEASATKAAGKALEDAVRVLDKPTPPDGTNGSTKGNGGAQNASGAITEASTAPSSPRAMLSEYSAHLASIPDRGGDRGAARIAGGYFKRREDFTEAGVRAEALGLVVDELARRGVAEPHTWLTSVGEKNGYVTRTRKAA